MENADIKVEVHAKCRRGNDRATHGQSCESLKAYRLSEQGSNVVSLKCAKCGFVWNIPVGGSVSL